MSDYKLSHLQELEAESIYIIREAAAEFENPVMLFSIGKDSCVMTHLAEPCRKSVRSRESAVSADAHRLQMEIQGND